MPRGGFRPGAGRPSKAKAAEALPADIKKAARQSKLSPLDYMLTVMNDAGADDGRRDRMAIAAAPFVHAKPADKPLGKKDAAQNAAETAGEGTGWGDDLSGPTLN